MLVDEDAASLAELESGGFGQPSFGAHADRGHHQRRRQGLAVGQSNRIGAHLGDRRTRDDAHPVSD